MVKKILIGLLIVLVLIQFIPAGREIPEDVPQQDFLSLTNAPENISVTLKNACFDCHSYKTEYPWYASVAPVSFWINDHIDHGRSHLNFDEWANYDLERQDHKLEELIEEVEEGNMPLDSYTWVHGEAVLSAEEVESLISWAKELRTQL